MIFPWKILPKNQQRASLSPENGMTLAMDFLSENQSDHRSLRPARRLIGSFVRYAKSIWRVAKMVCSFQNVCLDSEPRLSRNDRSRLHVRAVSRLDPVTRSLKSMTEFLSQNNRYEWKSRHWFRWSRRDASSSMKEIQGFQRNQYRFKLRCGNPLYILVSDNYPSRFRRESSEMGYQSSG